MKTKLPGLPTVADLMLTAMITVWLGLWGLLDPCRIDEWKTLAGSFLAIGGVALTAIVAARNVTRQIRNDILRREEDRVERSSPGLGEADYFAGGFLKYRVFQAWD